MRRETQFIHASSCVGRTLLFFVLAKPLADYTRSGRIRPEAHPPLRRFECVDLLNASPEARNAGAIPKISQRAIKATKPGTIVNDKSTPMGAILKKKKKNTRHPLI